MTESGRQAKASWSLVQVPEFFGNFMERVIGFEPTTLCLAIVEREVLSISPGSGRYTPRACLPRVSWNR
jgi:hypothetical protein